MSMPGSLPLNAFLQPEGSPITRARRLMSAIASEGRDDLQGKAIRMSNINLENAVEVSDGATATGSFSGGSILYLTSKLTPLPRYKENSNLAVPFTSIYLGTVSGIGTAQIYPYPATAAIASQYRVTMAPDYHLTQLGTTGVGSFTWSCIRGFILDTSGTSNTSITLTTKWKTLRYNISQDSTSG